MGHFPYVCNFRPDIGLLLFLLTGWDALNLDRLCYIPDFVSVCTSSMQCRPRLEMKSLEGPARLTLGELASPPEKLLQRLRALGSAPAGTGDPTEHTLLGRVTS